MSVLLRDGSEPAYHRQKQQRRGRTPESFYAAMDVAGHGNHIKKVEHTFFYRQPDYPSAYADLRP